VEERLAEKGVTTITKGDLDRELRDLQQERATQVKEGAGRFAGGGLVDIGDLKESIQAGGKLEDLQKQLRQFGGLCAIFGGAAQIAPGPLMGVESSVMALAGSYKEAMTGIETAVEKTATFVETRLIAANSRVIQNIVNAVEQAFIRKIVDESARG